MHVSLTAELESRVKAKVESGLYNNASEVIREALRFMDTHEDWIHEVKLARLREQLKVGTGQIDSGEGISIKSKSSLDSLFNDIMA
ncbi:MULTISPECIES: type II toxin-antitoxin system ParD family antitoxin [unclassified Oleiphilus]|jgi:antitoxin ParD1/3/4|uniref:type II toxin-antitoxin system ParD family antitoxin n=1 Tax=unclassified Oleiphilus TaxID=2631174 RepID=UPI0007C210FD|nr:MULTISPECIES: type II toxin-antitoxin system ParD family antitoxin [unclassified Oleiphilus]KZY45266.1 addiction module antidote protein [Oleiphilus sp. HI0050]KZY89489.1 addiction module antidote protein [Oleiphilus sp. HI0072]KZZ11306.1 addiction module antidote protein [Oleiphilus sp. HI0078]KZZ20854.1 addiction module antidote protein [Oleiphilus sp. HI0081]KZY58653.1 addiction module antidote protein [Oleiphilus sp. HI0061]